MGTDEGDRGRARPAAGLPDDARYKVLIAGPEKIKAISMSPSTQERDFLWQHLPI